MVRRAKEDADARWGWRLCEKFEGNMKMFCKEVLWARIGETGKDEMGKVINGRLVMECGDVQNLRP